MNIIDIEQRLEPVSLINPSHDYLKKGLKIFRNARHDSSPLKLGIQFAVAASLIVSLCLNFLQFSGQDLQGKLLVENVDVIATDSQVAVDSSIPALLAEVASTGNAVFNFLCFTSTSAIVDNSFFVGDLSGFGEWATFEIPEFFRVSLSLQPIRDWAPVGRYTDGTISIELEGEHLLTLNGTSLGPQGSRVKDQLTVYGVLEKIAVGVSNSPEVEKSIPADDYPATLAGNLLLASQVNPFRSIAGINLGVDTVLDPVIRSIINPILISGGCG
jgi:hypothetical protein